MDTKVNYTLVGAFVMGLCIAGVILFLVLTGTTNEEDYQPYLVYATSGVSGLTVQSPVEFNGVRVGYVKSINLVPKDPQLVQLLLYIQVGTPISQSTYATLVPQGITGVYYVGLFIDKTNPNAPKLKAQPGEIYPVIKYKVPLLVRLDEVLHTVTDNITKVSNSISDVAESFKRMFSEENSQEFHRLLQNGVKATGQISDQIAPDLQQLIRHLDAVSGNLDQVISDVKNNPAVLIRGKKPLPKGPGEQ